jgi:hypothetical protein
MDEENKTKILLPMLRKMAPNVIANSLVGVQPKRQPINIATFECKYCKKIDCSLFYKVAPIHTAVYVPLANSSPNDYIIIAKKSKELVEAFFHDVLIVEYLYNVPIRHDYFETGLPAIPSTVFKQELLALRNDLHHQDKYPEVTEDSLADHGIYFYG